MSVKVIIFGTHKRDENINKNKAILGLSDEDIIYDDRPNGGLPIYTCKKAWRSVENCKEDWVCALQDDVELCDNFKKILEDISNTLDVSIVGLCNFNHRLEYIMKNFRSYPYFEDGFVMGPAIMMPTKLIKPCFDWIDSKFDLTKADDEAICEFARENNIPIINTNPTVVQHIGDSSLIGHPTGRYSISWVKSPNQNWKNKEIKKRFRVGPMLRKILKPW